MRAARSSPEERPYGLLADGAAGGTGMIRPGPPAPGQPGRRVGSQPQTQQFRIYRPRSPYLDRDAERAYLTQIIKDDDLVSAFLAHRFFVDRLRRHCNEPVIVLIPVALPDKLRYRFLHNHVDLVLTRELRYPAGRRRRPRPGAGARPRPCRAVENSGHQVPRAGQGQPRRLPARGMRATMRWRNAGVSQLN